MVGVVDAKKQRNNEAREESDLQLHSSVQSIYKGPQCDSGDWGVQLMKVRGREEGAQLTSTFAMNEAE